MTPNEEFPGIASLAAHVARYHGLKHILVIGALSLGDTAIAHPELEFIDVRLGSNGTDSRRQPGFGRRVVLRRSVGGVAPVTDPIFDSSMIVYTAIEGAKGTTASALGDLRWLLDRVPVVVVATSDAADGTPVDFANALATVGLSPTFLGRAEWHRPRDAMVAIVDRSVGDHVEAAPADFRVVAIITAYNEADVIGATIEALVAGGIDVYLIDNWSTDRTYQIAEGYLDHGLIGLERFPAAPTSVYDWTGLLERVEVIASTTPSRWSIHQDADERREGPWSDHSLRDALWAADRAGFNAVDHTVLNFRPIDNGFVPGSDYVAYFRNFEFGDSPDIQRQVKAWRNTGQRVSLAPTGGHDVAFPGRRVFPYKFLLRHYPIRSQAHGERKVLVERRSRWNRVERSRGWHRHYDSVTTTHQFVRDRSELIEFVDGRTRSDYLLSIVAGVGIGKSDIPRWALNGRTGALTYRSIRRLAMLRGFVRHSILPRIPLARRVARRMRRSAADRSS